MSEFNAHIPMHLVTINPRRRAFMAPALILAIVCAGPGIVLAVVGLGLVFIGSELLAWLEGPRK